MKNKKELKSVLQGNRSISKYFHDSLRGKKGQYFPSYSPAGAPSWEQGSGGGEGVPCSTEVPRDSRGSSRAEGSDLQPRLKPALLPWDSA